MAKADVLSLDFASHDPAAFARTLSQGRPREIADILNSMPLGDAAAVAARMPVKRLGALVATDKVDARAWLMAANLDDAVRLAGQLPREHILALIESVDDTKRRNRLLQFLKYPAHSVGSVVSDVHVRIPADLPAGDYYLKGYAWNQELDAAGSEKLQVN